MEVMKKILSALVIICVASVTPAFAKCATKETEIITGSACSINELNNAQPQLKSEKRLVPEPRSQRNLRPVRRTATISNQSTCPSIICLNRILLGNPLEGFNK